MNLYSVYWHEGDRAMWATSTNKRRAIAFAKPRDGAVYVFKGPIDRWRGSWDAPTLRAVSDLVWRGPVE